MDSFIRSIWSPTPWGVAVFEVANRRYPGNPHIEALLKSVDRFAVDRAESTETHFAFP
jgi:hypothetical protein